MSIVGAVVMIGLTSLLLWKLLMTINDRRVERREYVEFEKELRTITRWHIVSIAYSFKHLKMLEFLISHCNNI